MKNKLTTLTALSAAAMAIPGHSETIPDKKSIGVRYTSYQEADSPRERTFTPETERYQINILQVGYNGPLNENWYLNTELQYETLSGASPTRTYENEEGRSVLEMSGASIEEARTDIKVSPRHYFDSGTAAVTLSASTENDYDAYAIGTDGTLEIFDKHTTLIGAFSISKDTLSPTDPQLSTERQAAKGRSKQIISVYEGLSQIIDKYSTLQVGFGYTRLNGFLSDPYKFEDRRPGSRDQYVLSTQYKHFLDVMDGAALHGEYRFYRDDWGINSHTLGVRWAQQLSLWDHSFRITPLGRYYQQDKADFYSLTPDPDDDSPGPEFRSSDYRLSTYGAITIGVAAEVPVGDWTIHFDWQQYFSRESWVITGAEDEETPGLVNFTTLTLGFDYRL